MDQLTDVSLPDPPEPIADDFEGAPKKPPAVDYMPEELWLVLWREPWPAEEVH